MGKQVMKDDIFWKVKSALTQIQDEHVSKMSFHSFMNEGTHTMLQPVQRRIPSTHAGRRSGMLK